MIGKTSTVRLSLMGLSLLLGAILLLLLLLPAFGRETETQKPWTGKLKDGRVITQADLDQILQAHVLWLKSKGSEGQQADLGYADLSGADLVSANLNGAHMVGANLSQANLWLANLSGAYLVMANLNEADLRVTDLSGASLIGANLSGAIIRGNDLSKADLSLASLDDAIFEPKSGCLPELSHFFGTKGLSSIGFKESPHALVELLEVYKKAGMRNQEREVTFALNHTRRLLLMEEGWKNKDVTKILENLFQLICFEWTCGYGLNPGRPLQIMGLGIFVFALPYMLALKSKKADTGIWLVWLPDRVLKGEGQEKPVKLTTVPPSSLPPGGRLARLKWHLRRVFRILHLGLYFSLLSAFSLGWHDFNVGNWLSRVQKKEYTLRATGWVRSVAGLQSLLSVYLLALWVLSYFGRPFD